MGTTPQPQPPGAQQPQQVQQPPQQQPPAPQPGQPGYDPNTVPTAQLPQHVASMPPGAQQPGYQPPQPSAPPPGVQRPVRQADGTFALETPARQRYVGATEQEVYDRLYEAGVNATRAIADLSTREARARQAAQAALGGAPIDERGRVQQPKPQFSREIYAQLQDQDPLTASWYLMQHQFGFDSIEEAQERLPQLFDTFDEIEQDRTITAFYRTAPEFPATPQAVDALLNELTRTGMDFTADNLTHVHRSLMYQHQFDPRVGYAPVARNGQPQQQPGQPQLQPGAPDPRDAMMNMLPVVGPQGNYAFNPDGGFGVPAPPQTFAPAAPAPTYAPAPVGPGGYPSIPNPNASVAQPYTYGYAPPAPAPAPAAAPVDAYGRPIYPAPTPQYAPAPAPYQPQAYQPPPGAPAAIPVPTMASGGYGAPNPGINEDALYGMDRNELRARIEQMGGIGRPSY